MKGNIVVDGLRVEDLLKSLQEMISSEIINNNTIVVLDTFDGYRHDIESIFCEERKTLTISAKLHEEVCE